MCCGGAYLKSVGEQRIERSGLDHRDSVRMTRNDRSIVAKLGISMVGSVTGHLPPRGPDIFPMVRVRA